MSIALLALNRMAFGPRPGDLDAFNALGATDDARLAAFVEQQLNPAAIADTEYDTKFATMASVFTTLGKSVEQMWADHVVVGGDRNRPAHEARRIKWLRARYSKRQLFEVMVDFWHYHFNIYPWDDGDITGTFLQFDRDAVRANALGNFRTMLEAVTKCTPMLYYLDNYDNQVAGFNENWARELMELHTLGAENYLGVRDPTTVPKLTDGTSSGYVDEDVYEAAACFTGWRVNDNTWEQGVTNTGTLLLLDRWHDKRAKTVLGHRIPPNQNMHKDGLDVLDILAKHPGTARFIARKLCRRFISDAPPQSVVDAAAAVFSANVSAPDQIAKTLRVILNSAEFKASWGQKFKRPFEFATSALRGLTSELTFFKTYEWDSEEFRGHFDRMGQSIFGRRPPDGYPDVKGPWLNTNSVMSRWRFANAITDGWIEPDVNSTTQEKFRLDVATDCRALMPLALRQPDEIADFWIAQLLGRPMNNPAHRQEIIRFMGHGSGNDATLPLDEIDERLPHMVALILMSQDFQIK